MTRPRFPVKRKVPDPVLLEKMRLVRSALQAAGFSTPFTSAIKQGYSIKLGPGKDAECITALDAMLTRAKETLKGFENISYTISKSTNTRGGDSYNACVRVGYDRRGKYQFDLKRVCALNP